MTFSRIPWRAFGAALLAITGCSQGDTDDLQQWMQAQYNATKPVADTVHPPAEFVPQAYGLVGQADPFSTDKLNGLLQAGQSPAVPNSALLESELKRRKEPLEAFPLEEMVMVGSLDKGGQRIALVRVSGLLHQIRVGNYLGTHYGRVTRITENGVTVREIIQDGAGEWTERLTQLSLQEETNR